MLLDLNLPVESGLSLIERAVPDPIDVPILLISGQAGVPDAVKAIRGGAVNVLEKPLDPQTLLSEIERTLRQDHPRWRWRLERRELLQQIEQLTPREREVLSFVLHGRTSVEVAQALSISFRTVEVHRSRILSKTNSSSVTELVYRIMALDVEKSLETDITPC